MGEVDVEESVADLEPIGGEPARERLSGRRVLLLAVVGVAVVAAVLWWVYLPHHRPGLEPGESYGVDVSNHQGRIDWDGVAGDDIDFAYIKATEGGDFVDAQFSRNWTEAQAAGIEVGAYHFFTLCRSGADQAANFLDVVPVAESDLAPALDLELLGNCSERPPVDTTLDEIRIWLDEVESAAGREVVLYVGPHFEDLYGPTEVFDRRTWHRRILRRPGDDEWTFWQFSYFASVPGIDGGVDLNVRRPDR